MISEVNICEIVQHLDIHPCMSDSPGFDPELAKASPIYGARDVECFVLILLDFF